MKPTELFGALHQRFKLNLIRRAHNALYELGLTAPFLCKNPDNNIRFCEFTPLSATEETISVSVGLIL